MPRADTSTQTAHLCVMGVSGAGKSSVARVLADRLDRTFGDADDLHSAANIDKMAAGHPLTDDDRRPWLDDVVAWLDARAADRHRTVFACSALRRRYRDRLARADGGVLFVALDVPVDELRSRMRRRTGHFMKTSMLDSQLATLEPLDPDENGFTVSGDLTVEQTVSGIVGRIDSTPRRDG